MKKYSIYTLLLLLMISTNSCLFTEDEVFDDPAAQRLNHAIHQAETVLSNASNGWVMEYFPTNETEGYTFLIRFTEDGKAEVGSKNKYTPTYTVDSGCWEVIGDNGPVLTFNTFINNFHLFSDPRNPGDTGYNGVGLGGDYEFIILDVTDELIRLKGKKRGTDIVLRPLSSGQDWEAYYDVLAEMDAALFNQASRMIWTLTFQGKEYLLRDGASHIFNATPKVEEVVEPVDDEVELDFNLPFIVTQTGIRLAQPFQQDGESVQSFLLSDDKSSLYAADKPEVIITGEPTFSFFLNEDNWQAGTSWKITEADTHGAFKTAIEAVVASCKSKYKEDFEYFYFKHKPDRKSKTISFKSGKKYDGAYDFDITGSSDQITFANRGTMDKNGEIYLKNIDGFQDFVALFESSTFTITTDSPLCPSKLKFTSVKDANNWFVATLF